MSKPYSLDLRERVVAAIEAGASRHEAAEQFAVSVSSAIRWMQRFVRVGSAAAKPSGGSTSPLEAHAPWLLGLIAKHPDLTLDEIVMAMQREGIAGSRVAVWRFFKRHNITVKKKSVRATEQQRPDVARARRRWMREQSLFDPARLVFVDETATSTNLARLRGRCERGLRLIGHVPQGNWQTVTFVAGLRHDRMVAPFVINGAMNGACFLAYLEQCLVFTLKPDDVVIIDNLKAHHVAGVREAIEPRARRFVTCRNTRPTSTRSNWPSPNSKPFCARPLPDPFAVCGTGSAPNLPWSTSEIPGPRNAPAHAAPRLRLRDKKHVRCGGRFHRKQSFRSVPAPQPVGDRRRIRPLRH